MSQLNNSIWITWEDHRRSRELADAFGSQYICITYKGNLLIRYIWLSLRTLLAVVRTRPALVFCQNPSIVLNVLLVIFKNLLKYKLVADRHSNFKFHHQKSRNPKWVLFHYLSKVTLEKSDLVIVTNEFLKQYVESVGGRSAILEDKLPKLPLGSACDLDGELNFAFISTFSDDEPILEMAEAASNLPASMKVYITGNFRKYNKLDTLNAINNGNLVLTGFLPEVQYQSLLRSVDIVIVITDQEHTLTCGAYEAVQLEKPMVLSDTQCIKSYFNKGAIYSRPNSYQLTQSLLEAARKRIDLQLEVKELKAELINKWNLRFDSLCQVINTL